MKVYIVTRCDIPGEGLEIEGVFSSEEEAKKYIRSQGEDPDAIVPTLFIDEWEVKDKL